MWAWQLLPSYHQIYSPSRTSTDGWRPFEFMASTLHICLFLVGESLSLITPRQNRLNSSVPNLEAAGLQKVQIKTKYHFREVFNITTALPATESQLSKPCKAMDLHNRSQLRYGSAAWTKHFYLHFLLLRFGRTTSCSGTLVKADVPYLLHHDHQSFNLLGMWGTDFPRNGLRELWVVFLASSLLWLFALWESKSLCWRPRSQ